MVTPWSTIIKKFIFLEESLKPKKSELPWMIYGLMILVKCFYLESNEWGLVKHNDQNIESRFNMAYCKVNNSLFLHGGVIFLNS